MKNTLGTGGTWAGTDMELQGDRRAEVVEWMKAMGVSPRSRRWVRTSWDLNEPNIETKKEPRKAFLGSIMKGGITG